MLLFMLACSHPEVDVSVSVTPTTSSEFVTYDGVPISLSEGLLGVQHLELLAAAEDDIAWVPSLIASAYAHGEEGSRSLGVVQSEGSVDLLSGGSFSVGTMSQDDALSASLMLTSVRLRGTATPTSGPVAFELDIPLEDMVDAVSADVTLDGTPLTLLVGLPAFFSGVDWSQPQPLDGSSTVFSNSLLFGVRSTSAYTVRSDSHPLTERSLAITGMVGNAAAGEELYGQQCAQCHGADGEGGSGPELAGHLNGQARLEVVDVLLTGLGAMPDSASLSNEELSDLLAFVYRNHR